MDTDNWSIVPIPTPNHCTTVWKSGTPPIQTNRYVGLIDKPCNETWDGRLTSRKTAYESDQNAAYCSCYQTVSVIGAHSGTWMREGQKYFHVLNQPLHMLRTRMPIWPPAHATGMWISNQTSTTQSIDCDLTNTARRALVGKMRAKYQCTLMSIFDYRTPHQPEFDQNLSRQTVMLRIEPQSINQLVVGEVKCYLVMRLQSHDHRPINHTLSQNWNQRGWKTNLRIIDGWAEVWTFPMPRRGYLRELHPRP